MVGKVRKVVRSSWTCGDPVVREGASSGGNPRWDDREGTQAASRAAVRIGMS